MVSKRRQLFIIPVRSYRTDLAEGLRKWKNDKSLSEHGQVKQTADAEGRRHLMFALEEAGECTKLCTLQWLAIQTLQRQLGCSHQSLPHSSSQGFLSKAKQYQAQTMPRAVLLQRRPSTATHFTRKVFRGATAKIENFLVIFFNTDHVHDGHKSVETHLSWVLLPRRPLIRDCATMQNSSPVASGPLSKPCTWRCFLYLLSKATAITKSFCGLSPEFMIHPREQLWQGKFWGERDDCLNRIVTSVCTLDAS